MRIYRAIYRLWRSARRLCAIVAGLILICSPAGWATSASPAGDDLPVFARQGEKIVAKLIPRAKSTSVGIAFGAIGGSLAAVTAKPFEVVSTSGVDTKDFKSGLFAIRVADVAVSGEATISVASDFFSSSTEYWIFNEHQAVPWRQAETEKRPMTIVCRS